MEHTETIKVLNRLIEVAKDGEYGFGQCAERASSAELKSTFAAHQTQRQAAAEELQGLVRQYGGKPDAEGTIAGTLHRGWISLRETVTKPNDHAILEECERGEDVAKASYAKALKEMLPDDVRRTVSAQYEDVLRSHAEIKRLRDESRAVDAY